MSTRSHRILAMCVLLVLLLSGITYRLIQLQLVEGGEISQEVNANIIRKYTEPASRGEILDADGKVLAGNALGFSVQVDYYNWDKEQQNEVLQKLWELLSAASIPCNDVLPLTTDWPTRYTYDSLESGAGKKLAAFMEAREWGTPETVNAGRLLNLLCEYYALDPNLPLEERRQLIGLRYYLDDCQFSAYNTPLTLAPSVEISVVAELAEYAGELPGVEVQVVDSRKYPTTLAAHVLGRIGSIDREEYEALKEKDYSLNDVLGKNGMEKALETYLRGEDGVRAVEVDRRTGQVVTEYMVEETQPGNDCYLTIRSDLQQRAETALAETLASIKEKGAQSKNKDGADVEGGAVVVIRVNTGEVLAMASWPTYSLATFQADYSQNATDPLRPFWNRAAQGTYSPGSTFKMATALASLEEGIITPRTKITDKGRYERYSDYQPKCWIYRQHGRTHGTINVSEALKYSCNYFFYEMGYQLGIERLERYASQLGLGQRTGIEIEENAGILAGPEEREARGGAPWYPADVLMAAIGQGDHLFSPLQLANYVATLVGGGDHYEAHLLKSAKSFDNSSVVYAYNKAPINHVDMADSTLEAVKKGARGLATGSLSYVFRNCVVDVGCKTGTAETGQKLTNGCFVAFAPYDDPQIAVCVVAEQGGGGANLAPVALDIINAYFSSASTTETIEGENSMLP